jgi:hypothetical protein
MSGLQQVVCFFPDKEKLAHLDFLMELGHYGISCLWYQYKPFEVKGMMIAYYKDNSGLQEEEEAIAGLLEEIGEWTANCRKKRVFHYPKASQLVPKEFFREELNEAGLQLVFGELHDTVNLGELPDNAGPGISYRVKKTIIQQLEKSFPEIISAHSFRALQEAYLTDASWVINCNVYPNLLQVTVTNNRNPLLFRQYDYRGPEDAVYHLLSIVEHLELPKNELKLKLSGLIDEQSNLYLELSKYFEQISFRQHKLVISERLEIREMPKHLFYHILSLSACVS